MKLTCPLLRPQSLSSRGAAFPSENPPGAPWRLCRVGLALVRSGCDSAGFGGDFGARLRIGWPLLCFCRGKEPGGLPACCTLCSSCQGQTPILCLSPWGCGPNTTGTFFSFMNALSGGLASPSQEGRGTRQRRKEPIVPHPLTAVRGVTTPSLGGTEGWRTGTQVRSLSLQNDEKSLGVNCRREALTLTFLLGVGH